MELKFAYLFILCHLVGFSGCQTGGNDKVADLKIDAKEHELQRIEPLISHYYSTNPD